MNFVVGDKVILVRPYTSSSGKSFTLEELLISCPAFKEPQEIVRIEHSLTLLSFYRPEDIPALYFMINNKTIGAPHTCFDLYSSITTPQTHKCCCNMRDLMIRGCKCGGV